MNIIAGSVLEGGESVCSGRESSFDLRVELSNSWPESRSWIRIPAEFEKLRRYHFHH